MLPTLHQKVYKTALAALVQLQDLLLNGDREMLSAQFQEVQKLFREQVFSLTEAGIEPAIASRWQSMQTEIHRTLKLLETDLLFFKSSRQQETSQQRLKIVSDRLNQLMNFCQALLS